MKKILCASMMCADFGALAEEIRKLENAGIDMFHLDLMDGQFVPNFGMGLQDIEYICRHAKIPCDVHMMCSTPANYIEMFASFGAKIIYVHAEAQMSAVARTLQKIRDTGTEAGLAVNPGTAYATIEPLLNLADNILAMTVNPGFAGQRYIPFVDDKLALLAESKSRYGYRLFVDGACSPETIARLSRCGVDGFVLGTSALFGKGREYRVIIPELRNL